jgi:hypothetical protein
MKNALGKETETVFSESFESHTNLPVTSHLLLTRSPIDPLSELNQRDRSISAQTIEMRSLQNSILVVQSERSRAISVNGRIGNVYRSSIVDCNAR